MSQLPIPVQVGSEPSGHWEDIEERQRHYGDDAAASLRDMRRPSIARSDVDWAAIGFEPRWVGFETADCVVALQPSTLSGQGADEFDRFRQGAERRGETALVISPIGEYEGQARRSYNVFGPSIDSVSIGRTYTNIEGRKIGKGARVQIADDLSGADHHLALRLRNCNPAPTWRALSLRGTALESTHGREQHAPEGTLLPILTTELGEPVVAVWRSPDGMERRYVVPVETPWTTLLGWLLEQALPEFVPSALRRARRPLNSDQSLMTRRERDVRQALDALDANYAEQRSKLERQLNGLFGHPVGGSWGESAGGEEHAEAVVLAVAIAAGEAAVELDDPVDRLGAAVVRAARGEVRQER